MIPINEQLYPLPDGWQWVTIKDIADVKGGKRLPKGKNLVDYKTRYPYIRVTDFFDNTIKADELKYLEEDVYNSIKRYTISSKDVYISIAGSIGKVGTIPLDLDGANLTENAAKITRLRGVNQSFLMWFLTSDFAQGQIKDLTKSTTQPKLALFRIEKIPIPLPPLDEQQRIVALLDKLFADLDEAKALAQSVVDGSELRNTAILHKAFTGELSQLWRDEHGTTLDSWQRCLLGDVCQINPPKISTRDLSDDLEVSFVPMAAVSDVRGEITAPQRKPLREVKSGFTNFAEGDVLFAKITPCMENGKAALVGELVNHIGYGSTEFFVLRCGEKIFNRFVYHLVRRQIFRNEAKSVMAGAVGQQRVPKNFLLAYPINLPPLDEQKEIVRLLDDLVGREQRTKNLALKMIERVELMKKSILARAFRGELGTN